MSLIRRALAASIVQNIDDVALQLDHAALEHGKQADRPGADNDNVCLVGLAIEHAAKLGETAGE